MPRGKKPEPELEVKQEKPLVLSDVIQQLRKFPVEQVRLIIARLQDHVKLEEGKGGFRGGEHPGGNVVQELQAGGGGEVALPGDGEGVPAGV